MTNFILTNLTIWVKQTRTFQKLSLSKHFNWLIKTYQSRPPQAWTVPSGDYPKHLKTKKKSCPNSPGSEKAGTLPIFMRQHSSN